jgi:hypothetical protein
MMWFDESCYICDMGANEISHSAWNGSTRKTKAYLQEV